MGYSKDTYGNIAREVESRTTLNCLNEFWLIERRGNYASKIFGSRLIHVFVNQTVANTTIERSGRRVMLRHASCAI